MAKTERKAEQSSSKMDTVLKMLLIAFVSLLAFSSGVYFGKQMSDSDHQLKALETDFNTQTYTAENGDAKSAGGEETIGDEEVASLSDKYVNAEKQTAERAVASTDEKAAPAQAAAPAVKPAAPAKAEAPAKQAVAEAAPAKISVQKETPAKSKIDLSAAHRAAERVANNAAPTAPAPEAPVKKESRVPSSLPKSVGGNSVAEYTVQVASYPTPTAAKEKADELVKKGFPAFPVEATVNGKTWYRVSVGSFKTMKDATTYRAQLLKQADLQNAIVQKITR